MALVFGAFTVAAVMLLLGALVELFLRWLRRVI
jgi:hypothetical protein